MVKHFVPVTVVCRDTDHGRCFSLPSSVPPHSFRVKNVAGVCDTDRGRVKRKIGEINLSNRCNPKK
jgi:ribosomal protein L11